MQQPIPKPIRDDCPLLPFVENKYINERKICKAEISDIPELQLRGVLDQLCGLLDAVAGAVDA